jgi:putative ABC transport system substrate-binding protein
LVLLAAAIIAEAQEVKKIYRIGYLSAFDAASESSRAAGVRLALRERGYIEGQNIAIEYRYATGKRERYAELAAELVHLKVDLIVVAGGVIPIQAAKNATRTIPIIMTGSGLDPVKEGHVESLARPGGNVTGITSLNRELARSDWNCSRMLFPNSPVSRFSTIRPFRLQARLKTIFQWRRVR